MPDTSEKFMLVGRIIDKVLDNTRVVPDDEKLPGRRRVHYLRANEELSQLEIIQMIEEVYDA